MSYKTFYDDFVIPWGEGLRTLDIEDKSNICIFSQNRPEWYAVHMGNLSQSFRTCALYDTLGPKGVAFIISYFPFHWLCI